ncbi:hypothetical protein E2C01_039216 [Portunus trituberculatus]|uniref:Uncharacterized protein n=1 Tax=Portunus trituberculatus TaxID=210409 RepID=A0A5B7FJ99_PORTR|nr:hypothetical protein [Portunus trituberculatus]
MRPMLVVVAQTKYCCRIIVQMFVVSGETVHPFTSSTFTTTILALHNYYPHHYHHQVSRRAKGPRTKQERSV